MRMMLLNATPWGFGVMTEPLLTDTIDPAAINGTIEFSVI